MQSVNDNRPDPFDPDVKWIVHHSRMTDSLMFGPFDSHELAVDWCVRNNIPPYPRPLLPPSVEIDYPTLWGGWRR